MEKIDENIANALEIVPAVVGEVLPATARPAPEQVQEPSKEEKDLERDFTEARETMKRAIVKSEEATQSILEIAQESGEPRAYEVAAQLIGMTIDAQSKLIHLHKQRKDIRAEADEGGRKQTGVTNNNIFVGNTAELQKLIKSMKKGSGDAAQAG